MFIICDGYWVTFWSNGNLRSGGYYHSNKRIGYWEKYYSDGNLTDKIYYAK